MAASIRLAATVKSLSLIIGVVALLSLSLGQQPLNAQTQNNQKAKSVERESYGTKDLSTLEQDVISEINLARTNPAQYVRYLEDFRRSYNGKLLRLSNGQSLVTQEGVAALDEAINFVRSVGPLAPLEIRRGLVLGAKDHLDDLIKTGKTGHRGSDGSSLEDRLTRYGTWRDSVGEDIIYHSRTVARENVISLIIDDGVANRGHRKNIFKPTFGVIGIALAPPVESGTLGIITFAGGFDDKNATSSKPTVPTAVKY